MKCLISRQAQGALRQRVSVTRPLSPDTRPALPSSMTPSINPKYEHYCEKCTCLGYATINDESADLFVCAETVIARFSDAPDDYRATHISQLSATSDVFLLAAFRLYLDARGEQPYHEPAIHPLQSMQS